MRIASRYFAVVSHAVPHTDTEWKDSYDCLFATLLFERSGAAALWAWLANDL